VRLAGDYKPTRKKFGQNMPDAYTYKEEKIRVMTRKVTTGIKTGKHQLTMKNKTHCSL